MIPPAPSILQTVAQGLLRPDKSLPPWLFYDEEGSRLYELITELPEYYLTRAERSIFERQSDGIIDSALNGGRRPLQVLELGAGTATKSQHLLRAVVSRQGRCRYVPVDVSRHALEIAAKRLAEEELAVEVLPLVSYHEEAFPALRRLGPQQLVLFIGSSIGNFEHEAALALLTGIRNSLLEGGALLLGTDLRKSPSILVPAYDDAQGVTAAFNKNLLTRINRELEADFNLERFRHVALWNEAASRMEMHLESLEDQSVHIARLETAVRFRRGERIHTESSVKYDVPGVRALLAASGFALERTFFDEDRLFALHLARAS